MRCMIVLIDWRRNTRQHVRALKNQRDRPTATPRTRGASTDGTNVASGAIAGLVTWRICAVSKIDVFNTSSRTNRDPEFVT